jgi:hypothetical protein
MNIAVSWKGTGCSLIEATNGSGNPVSFIVRVDGGSRFL